MASEVVPQLAVVQVPHLHQLVPAARHDQRLLSRRREAHLAHPVRVSILRDGVLALREGVPEPDGLVAGAGDDLPRMFLTFFLTFGEFLANFERLVLGCIETNLCK